MGESRRGLYYIQVYISLPTAERNKGEKEKKNKKEKKKNFTPISPPGKLAISDNGGKELQKLYDIQ